MTPIDIRPADLETVRRILREHVPALEVRAFGSRVAWNARETSDLDLALMTDRPLAVARMADLRAAFTDAELPFRVDIVDWVSTPEPFRRVVEAEHVVLNVETPRSTSRWIHLTVADACEAIDYGLTAAASDQRSGPRFLRITDIVSGQIDWNSVPHVAADDGTSERYRLHDGDIVLARTGASTGASAYIKDPPRAVFASYLVRLRAKPTFSGRFLAYFLKSEDFSEYIRGVLGDKSAQPNASATTMTAAPLHAPRDKDDQSAIAHILGTLDDKIELNRRMNRTLEAMARAIFKDWFVDFGPVRAKMEGRHPYLAAEFWDLFPAGLDLLENEDNPAGWWSYGLSDLVHHHRGTVAPSAEPKRIFEHYSIPAHDAGGEPSLDLGGSIKSNKTIVPDGAVLLSKLNPDIERVWLPNPLDEAPQVASTEFLTFTPLWPATRSILFCLFKSDGFRGEMATMVTGTSKSHQRVPPKDLLARKVLVGEPHLFQAFDRTIRPVMEQMLANRDEIRTLAQIRDLLLPKLVSGDFRIREAEKVVEAVA